MAKSVAVDVLGIDTGQRLPSIGSYARRFDVGVGTVQAALTYLREIGAVELEPRGRRGTVVVRRNLGILWGVATDRPVIATLPSPYSCLLEGLVSALRESLREQLLNLAVVHCDGSGDRVRALVRGEADFAVVSSLAAELAIAEGTEIAVARSLGRGTLIQRHVQVRRGGSPGLAAGAVVAIEPSTLDQRFISELLVEGLDVTFRSVRFFEFQKRLLSHEIDVAVWHSDDIVNLSAPGVVQEPLPGRLLRQLGGRNTEAVLAVRRGDRVMASLLAGSVDVDRMRRVQARLIKGLRVGLD